MIFWEVYLFLCLLLDDWFGSSKAQHSSFVNIHSEFSMAWVWTSEMWCSNPCWCKQNHHADWHIRRVRIKNRLSDSAQSRYPDPELQYFKIPVFVFVYLFVFVLIFNNKDKINNSYIVFINIVIIIKKRSGGKDPT